MKRLSVLALLATVAVFALTAESQANGLFRRHKGCGDCGASACAAPCAAPCEAAPVKWEERKVTKYKSVMVAREIEVTVCKQVVTPEKYTYTVCTPVTRQEKRMQTICTPVMREVEYTCTVMVPRTVEKKVMCTTYRCVSEMVKECVPVCKTVCVTCVDECGRCHTSRERVTVMEERTRCVTRRIPETTEKTILVTVCEPQQQKGKRMVCEIQRTQSEVMVNVCSIERTQREGVRQVCSYVTEKVKRKVQECVMQPYQETIKVAVGGAACSTTTSCSSPACSDCGSGRGHRGGLFRRGHGCSSCN